MRLRMAYSGQTAEASQWARSVRYIHMYVCMYVSSEGMLTEIHRCMYVRTYICTLNTSPVLITHLYSSPDSCCLWGAQSRASHFSPQCPNLGLCHSLPWCNWLHSQVRGRRGGRVRKRGKGRRANERRLEWMGERMEGKGEKWIGNKGWGMKWEETKPEVAR